MRPTFPGEIFPEKVERPRGPEKVMARRGDPETSFAAARSVSNRTVLQGAITAVLLQHGPMTDEEILLYVRSQFRDLTVTPSGARTRRAELVEMGRVEDTGTTSPTASGRRSINWRAIR